MKDILNRYEMNRKDLEPLIRNIHKRKPSYGYHRINTIIRRETGWILVHKVCKILKIRSNARHYSIYKKQVGICIKRYKFTPYNISQIILSYTENFYYFFYAFLRFFLKKYNVFRR